MGLLDLDYGGEDFPIEIHHLFKIESIMMIIKTACLCNEQNCLLIHRQIIRYISFPSFSSTEEKKTPSLHSLSPTPLKSSAFAVPCSFFLCWVFPLESPKAVQCPFIWLHSLLAAGLHTLRLAVAPFRARYGGRRHFVFYDYFVFSPIPALTDHRFIPLPCYHQARQNSQ